MQVYGRELPAVVQCFTDDFAACIAHLRFPLRHRKVIRTKSPRAPLPGRAAPYEDHPARVRRATGPEADVRAMIRAPDRWRGITVGELDQRQLKAIREELNRAHAERVRPAVRPAPSASPSRLSSKART